ncbi:hypothetical protein GLOIN_2v1775597 [Rhizophagus irregularis DAOM 181602=DAOM 197198]|uniref:Uncharacterized protein n=1 Tax=Rhizophagus irregularis (strain DAOM 181602 / DAOM 197198 / MUCL 43194) TaxID=747089 RepID=A0A2P4PZA5_RHIID|nr:hypothetical protein GLOIN_2v1775597 [Rhizophagus irregularis DAOM 181602=DAOM 197198]POG70725.1 hypothetical protein GLOIN_2v1775597 [Rhizophagus irregularis DAOM 181602=DAOM 197198]GET65556.1 hypothetical protein GLOIN_2v1775597 [Rhizophagus irregularis DAOM 181602=DAOM 197198]|eukprot:XP_025177591.1 hypothetical protein GLOIN_2v1775597 [Rhizophagus irregularis DAOM 181602=DAOM 197198]
MDNFGLVPMDEASRYEPMGEASEDGPMDELSEYELVNEASEDGPIDEVSEHVKTPPRNQRDFDSKERRNNFNQETSYATNSRQPRNRYYD